MRISHYVTPTSVVGIVGNNVVLSDLTSGASVELFSDTLPIESLLFLPDLGAVVFGGHSKKIIAMDLNTRAKLYELQNDRKITLLVRCVLTPNILCIDSSGAVKKFHSSHHLQQQQQQQESSLSLLFAHFSPISSAVVVGPYIITADMDCQVRVSHEQHPRDVLFFLMGHSSPVVAMTRGSDDMQVACISRDKSVRYFSLITGQPVDPFEHVAQPAVSSKLKKAKRENQQDK